MDSGSGYPPPGCGEFYAEVEEGPVDPIDKNAQLGVNRYWLLVCEIFKQLITVVWPESKIKGVGAAFQPRLALLL
jgi:hypothetical protein